MKGTNLTSAKASRFGSHVALALFGLLVAPGLWRRSSEKMSWHGLWLSPQMLMEISVVYWCSHFGTLVVNSVPYKSCMDTQLLLQGQYLPNSWKRVEASWKRVIAGSRPAGMHSTAETSRASKVESRVS